MSRYYNWKKLEKLLNDNFGVEEFLQKINVRRTYTIVWVRRYSEVRTKLYLKKDNTARLRSVEITSKGSASDEGRKWKVDLKTMEFDIDKYGDPYIMWDVNGKGTYVTVRFPGEEE